MKVKWLVQDPVVDGQRCLLGLRGDGFQGFLKFLCIFLVLNAIIKGLNCIFKIAPQWRFPYELFWRKKENFFLLEYHS